MKFLNVTSSYITIASAIENLDFVEIYNSYAVWINKNRWAWKSGDEPARKPFHLGTRPNGLTAFAKEHYKFISESEIQKFQRKCTHFLSNHPEVLKEKADIFSEMFPTIIQIKIEKKEQKTNTEEKLLDNNLRSHFNMPEDVQMELSIIEPSVKNTDDKCISKLSELTNAICAFAERGAKSIKSPDGWEIQF